MFCPKLYTQITTRGFYCLFSLHLYKIIQVFLSLKMKGGMLMIELTREDILKNRVNTISQFKVLKYLKSCLNIAMFHFYLVKNGIKVVDNKEDTLYFYYDEMTKDVITSEESISFEKGIDLEL